LARSDMHYPRRHADSHEPQSWFRFELLKPDLKLKPRYKRVQAETISLELEDRARVIYVRGYIGLYSI
jgi:hypothetical protein